MIAKQRSDRSYERQAFKWRFKPFRKLLLQHFFLARQVFRNLPPICQGLKTDLTDKQIIAKLPASKVITEISSGLQVTVCLSVSVSL